MPHKVHIRQFDRTVTVDEGQTVLEAALAAGLDYPFGCQSGLCGTCKSVLVQGEVKLREHSEFALTEEEQRQGYILACQSLPQRDSEVAYLDPDEPADHPHRVMTTTVSDLERLTSDITKVEVMIDGGVGYDFSPGQFSRLTFPGQPPRDYSMASMPGRDRIEFHIRLTPDGRVSRFVLEELSPGDAVTVEGPYGVSYLRRKHRGPILALAGGSGLAPIKSIVEGALADKMAQPITLYLAARTEDDLYLVSHFRALADRHANLTVKTAISEAQKDGAGHLVGHLADVIADELGDLDGHKAYLAGPPIMVETCLGVLQSHGVRPADCHADAFYTEAEAGSRRIA